jgi:hypothetical protein
MNTITSLKTATGAPSITFRLRIVAVSVSLLLGAASVAAADESTAPGNIELEGARGMQAVEVASIDTSNRTEAAMREADHPTDTRRWPDACDGPCDNEEDNGWQQVDTPPMR